VGKLVLTIPGAQASYFSGASDRFCHITMPKATRPEHAWYEQRYRAVYGAGVRCATGRDPGADSHFRAFLEQQPARGRLIDFGCGEGFPASWAADLGYRVLAIDSAPSAITKAREIHCHPNIEYLVADVCELDHLPSASFDVAVDLGCFHVIVDEDAVDRYLAQAARLLKPGGRAYYQNLVPADDAEAWCPRERGLVEWWRQRIIEASEMTTRSSTYEVDGRQVEVKIPVIPSAKRDLRQQVSLLTRAGFVVESARVVTPGMNSPFEAVLVAARPG
jgi:SAM-dependent methyltransferase